MVDTSSDLDVDSAFHADARTMMGLVVTVLIGAVATAAGVGGGAIYIPIFNTLIGFALKPSTALSQACITAGSLAAVLSNIPRTHPSGADVPLIDFPLMLMLTPVLLVGVGMGVFLNVMLPSWLLNILLLVLLLLLMAQAIAKGRALWKAENTRKAELEAAAAEEAEAAAMGADGAGVDDGAGLMPRGGPSSSAVLPTALSGAGAGLRHRHRMSYSNSGAHGPDADVDVQTGYHGATAEGAPLPFDVIGAGGANTGRLDPALSAVAAGDGDGVELSPPDSPVRNIPYGTYGTPRTPAAASQASLETAASWMAFNELGFVGSDGEGSDSETTHAFSARSNFSLPVFMRPSESTARLLSMLALRPPGRGLAGPLLERRASFDPHGAAVIAAAVAAGEDAGAEPDSWLARRSKWRSRFPTSALPHRTRPPPLQQQRSTSLLRNRSVRQQDMAGADDDASIAQPLLDRQAGHGGTGPRPDPQADYGSAATAAGVAATEGGGGGRGDRSGAAAAEGYRPPTPLETLHEEGGEEVVSRGASLTDQSRAAARPQSRIAGAGASPFVGSPFAAAAAAIEGAGEAAAPAALPVVGTATADRETPLGRRSSASADAGMPAGVGDGGSPYGSPGALAHRRYGSKSLSSLGGAAAAAATPRVGHLELEGPAARDDGGGMWRGRCRRVAASGTAALRKSRSKWAAALRRVPRSYTLALLAAWALYLLLQALRAVQQRCEPAWWALFLVQIFAMLAISIGTVVLARKARRAQAACLEGAAAEEGRSCAASLTAPAPPSPDRTDGPPPPSADRKSDAPAAAPIANTGNDGSTSAAVLVLRAPLATLAVTFGAGLTGGLLGLGGGMVMGPLLLQLGVHPQVTAATSGAMVLFSSSSALAQFAMLHRLNVPYAVVFGAGSLVAGVVGTNLVARAIKRSGRPSLVVLALAGVMAVGTLSVGIFGMRTAVKELEHGAKGFQGICAGGAGR